MYNNIINDIVNNLNNKNIEAQISSRLKDPRSIFIKMNIKETDIDHLDDILGFRIIVNDQISCYKARDIIHNCYDICHLRFKDYIIEPKENLYQSLHTIIITKPYNRKIEIQIRSKEMHKIADIGDAKHNDYKQSREQLLRKNFPLDLDRFLEPAYSIMNQFDGTEVALMAYEHEIKRIAIKLKKIWSNNRRSFVSINQV